MVCCMLKWKVLFSHTQRFVCEEAKRVKIEVFTNWFRSFFYVILVVVCYFYHNFMKAGVGYITVALSVLRIKPVFNVRYSQFLHILSIIIRLRY